jgi:Zn-dependent protease with chaperone function
LRPYTINKKMALQRRHHHELHLVSESGWRTKVPKAVRAFFLGLLSLFLFMFVGETAGLFPAFILMVAYFSICQFLLSRGNVDAYRKDWRVMLALDATVFVCVFIMVLVEKRAVVLSQGVGLLLSGCGGTYVGAVVASLTARRRAVRQVTVTVSLAFRRRSLLTSAVLLVVVALVVAAAVIPPVRADIFPRAAPQRAATAFWANVACNLLAATVLVFIAVRATGRSRLSTTILELMAFLAGVVPFRVEDESRDGGLMISCGDVTRGV